MANKTIVDQTGARQRLDVYVAALFPLVSRSYIRHLADANQLLVNGQPQKAGYKLREGDELELPDIAAAAEAIPPNIDLPILYEDKDCLVVDKPIGLLTHARGGINGQLEASVASFLRHYVHGLTGERAGVVHRLDRATSGVLIGAKNPAALSWLQQQFSKRKVQKTYVAVVSGQLTEPEALIDLPIERNPKAPATFRVGANGKPAATQYKVLEQSKHYSLLELQPKTGRTHQLRVHLAHLGHPIVGDTLYNGPPADRLFLHAYQLQIDTPDGQTHLFESPIPKEFKELMDGDS